MTPPDWTLVQVTIETWTLVGDEPVVSPDPGPGPDPDPPTHQFDFSKSINAFRGFVMGLY